MQVLGVLRQVARPSLAAVAHLQTRAMSGQRFSTMTTGTLKDASLKDAADAALKDVKAALDKAPGFVMAQRHYCGGQQTYRVVTVWDSVDALKGHGNTEGYAEAIDGLAKNFADGTHVQNFYFDDVN